MLFLKYELIKANVSEEDYVDFLSYMRDFLREKKSDRSYTEVFAKACESEISKVQS